MTGIDRHFICGVVEGFYGRPWTSEQRKDLFCRINKIGMNSYVYAPKDDLKHRAYWRDSYTIEEADHLQSLIESAKENNVDFYYALSPGLDISYSNPKEINAIKQKLEQVKRLGCECFALLFDDIEPTMSDIDKQKFTSFAEAQVNVTNDVFEYLRRPKFMFCPTEYCESRALPSLENSDYLNYIGRKLASDVKVLWTGPRVISRTITSAHLSLVRKVLRRKPLIWDNLHANDYDNKRVFLGPYAGRSATIKIHLSGVVTNPNCEFEANFIAMHTLAFWNKCTIDADIPIYDDATFEAGGKEKIAAEAAKKDCLSYHPLKALKLAIDDWLPEISEHRMAFVRPLTHQPCAGIAGTAAPVTGITSTTSSTSSLSSEMTLVYSGLSAGGGNLPMYTPPSIVESVTNPFAAPPLIENNAATLLANINSSTGAINGGLKNDGTNSTGNSNSGDDVIAESSTPVLTAVLQAVNSLTDEYSEPMELVPPLSAVLNIGSSENSSTEFDSSPSIKKPKTAADGFINANLNHATSASSSTIAIEITMENGSNVSSACNSVEDKSVESLIELGIEPVPPLSGSSVKEVSMSDDHLGDGQKRRHSSTTAVADALARLSPIFEDHGGQQRMQVDGEASGDGISNPAFSQPLFTTLNRADLQLLCELFYLPFEHGPRANFLIEEFVWLKTNVSVVRQSRERLTSKLAEEWTRRAASFDILSKLVTDLCVRLVLCPNRGLVYDFYPYLFDLQGVLNSLNSYLKWLGFGYYCDKQQPPNGLTEPVSQIITNVCIIDGEPWTVRRALIGEFQKLLPLESAADLFICRPPHPPCGRIFKARPYSDDTDRKAVYDICRTTFLPEDQKADFRNHTELIGDRFVGAFLELCPSYCFVVEELDNGIVGFAVGALDAAKFYEDCKKIYIPRMQIKYDRETAQSLLCPSLLVCRQRHQDRSATSSRDSADDDHADDSLSVKNLIDTFYDSDQNSPKSLLSRYPSLVYVRLLPQMLDTVAPKRLLVAQFAALKSNGSQGVYCEVGKKDRFTQDMYNRWNFFEISMLDEEAFELNYFGRLL